MKRKNKEEPSDHYDLAYTTSKAYGNLPHEIREYYDMWVSGAEDVLKADPVEVVDFGCGPGHFAHVLQELLTGKETKFRRFSGFDFSPVALEMAKRMVSDSRFTFQKCDLNTYDFSKNRDSNTVYVSYEFLEHIHRDLEILSRIPSGSYISFSVPSFNSKGHVRFFESADEVRQRYGKTIDIHTCKVFKKNQNSTEKDLWLYLCFGRKL